MVDLASIGNRRTQARQITQNRDAILPQRRDTDAPNLTVRSDLRSAQRGDGGADELRRTLSAFLDAGEGAFKADTARSVDKYKAEAAEGVAAAAAGGDADPARQKSISYQEAFYRVRAESSFNTFSQELATEAEEMVNAGADPDEVQAAVYARITEFSNGVMETIPTATARMETGVRLADMARTLETNVNTRIRERVTAESVETLQGNLRTSLATGQPFDAEARIAEARALNLPPQRAKEVVMEAALAFALDPQNPNVDLIDQLIDSTQADGKTPTFNAAEIVRLQNAYAQGTNLAEAREREMKEEARDTLLAEVLPQVLAGEHVSPRILAAIGDGSIDANLGTSLLGMTENLRSVQADGYANDDFVLDVAMAEAKDTPMSASALTAAYQAGRFGTGNAARRAYIQALGNSTSHAQTARAARAGGGGGRGGGGGFSITNPRRQWAFNEVKALRGMDEEGRSSTDRQVDAAAIVYFNDYMRRPGATPEDALQSTRERFTPGQRGQSRPASTPTTYTYDAQGNLRGR